MQSGRDPVQRAAGKDRDLYEVSTWEPRSRLDRLIVWADAGVRTAFWRILYVVVGVIGLAALALSVQVLADQYRSGQLNAVSDPVVTALVVLSVVPALALAAYVWRADVTTGEPPALLVVTFLLIVLLIGIVAILNELGRLAVGVERGTFGVATILFFYLVVGPVEESAKLLAVRLHAYRSDRFDAVVDGAVYGAVAGLGFATVENALYITSALEPATTAIGTIESAQGITAARALAGPGHVIYSAIAGFYLGLAKFNREYAAPLVLKGLLVAVVLHGTYNVGASVVPGVVHQTTSLSPLASVMAFVVPFDTVAGYYLYRKLSAYRDTYRDVEAGRLDDRVPAPELAEFDPPSARNDDVRDRATVGAVGAATGIDRGRSERDAPSDGISAHREPERGRRSSVGDGGESDGKAGERGEGDDEDAGDSLDDWEF